MAQKPVRVRFHRCDISVGGIASVCQIYEPPGLSQGVPVILFLHGAGESGEDGFKQTTVGIGPAIKAAPKRFPALVVFPQASRGYGWRDVNLATAAAALDEVERSYDVDRDRVYVTGLSMGGYGAWLLALLHPDRFAAIVPVCGGLDRRGAANAGIDGYAQAARTLRSIPQWIFHGDADDIIPVEQSRRMVSALRKADADVRYTEYAGVRHNSWDQAYAEPELMPWLLCQRRVHG